MNGDTWQIPKSLETSLKIALFWDVPVTQSQLSLKCLRMWNVVKKFISAVFVKQTGTPDVKNRLLYFKSVYWWLVWEIARDLHPPFSPLLPFQNTVIPNRSGETMLDTLPEELILNILQLVEHQDNISISRVNKKLNCVSQDNTLWCLYMRRVYSHLNLPFPTDYEHSVHWKARMVELASGYINLIFQTERQSWYCQLSAKMNQNNENLTMTLGPFGTPECGLLASTLFLDNTIAFDNCNSASTNLIGVMIAFCNSFGVKETWAKNKSNEVLSEIRKYIGRDHAKETDYQCQLKDFLDDNRIGYRMLISSEPKKKRQHETTRVSNPEQFQMHIPKRRRFSHYIKHNIRPCIPVE